jgi:beta-lactamase regulating signal transducer with metallopeptidase domain
MSFHQWLNDWSAWGWPVVAGHLWQATLFCGAIFCWTALLRRAPARVRHGLWLIAAAKFVVPSALFVYLVRWTGIDLSTLNIFSHARTPVAPIIYRVAEPVFQFTETPVTSSAQSVEVLSWHQNIYGLLTLAWLAGCAFLLVRWWLRRRRLVRCLGAVETTNGEREVQVLERMRLGLGIKRHIKLITSTSIESPGVWGVRKPVLLFPKNFAACLSDDELEAVLTHELIHVKRRDNLTGNLQMLLCCTFWFHPVVWLLDRKLLAERERACDDEVLRLGSASQVYAKSLMKVSRFGLGFKSVGLSAAAGSQVRRRIERIMAQDVVRKLTLTHKMLMSATVLALIIFSAGAGLLRGDAARAQNSSGKEAMPRQSGEANVEMSANHPVALLSDGSLSEEQAERIRKQLDEAAEVLIQTENEDGAPLKVVEARVKVVTLEKDLSARGRAQELVSPSTIKLVNRTNARITFLRLSLKDSHSWHDIVGFNVSIAPRGEYVLHPDWRKWSNTIEPGNAARLIAQIIAVKFEDGSSWGKLDPRDDSQLIAPSAPSSSEEATPPPDAPVAQTLPATAAGDGKDFPSQFENPAGAPLVITEAHARSVALTDDMRVFNNSREAASLPVVTLSNTTGQRIVAIKLRFKADAESHAVTAFRVTIEPHASYTFSRNSVMSGSAERMRVQVLGVQFEDGSVWGSLDSTINARDAVVPIPNSISRARPSNYSDAQPTPVAPTARIEVAETEQPSPQPLKHAPRSRTQ